MTAMDVQITGRPDGMDTYPGQQRRMGFLTDTSVRIGRKAREVAREEGNHVPEDGLALTAEALAGRLGMGGRLGMVGRR